jgi:exodeoxyribonuclease-3
MKTRLLSAGVDRDVRGWEKASDHAPTWIVIADEIPLARRKKKSSQVV